MTLNLQRGLAALPLALGMLTASLADANTPIRVDVERAAEKAYTVDAAFDVAAPSHIVWEVLTDYEGISKFVSSVRQSTVRRREPGRVLLEQHGVGRAWIFSIPMHVVLDVREQDQRVLAFRDTGGESFTAYEGTWELANTGSGTRVTYRLVAEPNVQQPANLARAAMRGIVRRLLEEVRHEVLARAAR
jgi:carbon monoxide dehydrogenase subunit G